MELFAVGSTLCPDRSKPLCYTTVRSAYTDEERLQQTLHTIATIRQHVPGAYVVLADNSAKIPESTRKQIEPKCDAFFHSNDAMQRALADGPYKGAAEAYLLLQTLAFLKRTGIEWKRFWKLSGRYWLNDKFDIRAFSETKVRSNLSVVLLCFARSDLGLFLPSLRSASTTRAMMRAPYSIRCHVRWNPISKRCSSIPS